MLNDDVGVPNQEPSGIGSNLMRVFRHLDNRQILQYAGGSRKPRVEEVQPLRESGGNRYTGGCETSSLTMPSYFGTKH